MTVDDMKMYHRMKGFGPAVAICTLGTSHHKTGGFHYRKPFGRRRHRHHLICIYKLYHINFTMNADVSPTLPSI